jgi:HSP20 family protein
MLVRWNPFKELESLHSEIDRLFGESFPSRTGGRGEIAGFGWTPHVDIFEDREAIDITVDLPGIEQKDVKLNIDNNVLTLSGERKLERENKKDNYHRMERFHGTFSRSFSLPNTVNAEKVDAHMEHGVLKIHLPKREEAKPKLIDIKVK